MPGSHGLERWSRIGWRRRKIGGFAPEYWPDIRYLQAEWALHQVSFAPWVGIREALSTFPAVPSASSPGAAFLESLAKARESNLSGHSGRRKLTTDVDPASM